MEPTRTLIDTSAWIEAFRRDGNAQVRATVIELTEAGLAVLCDMVLLELWNGARGSTEHRLLRDLEKDIEVAPTTAEVWSTASDLARVCCRKRLTIPATDLLIAACARFNGLDLLHVDAHFDQIPSVSS